MLKKSRKYVNKINNSRVYDVAIRSPITKAENLSSNLKNKIFLKREDLQPTHSFKIRGAYNKISHLVNKDNVNHIVTASAGNHAQGFAFSCKKLKIKCNIVMPVTAPENKIKAVRRLKAKVTLYGENLSHALKKANEIAKENKYTFVHPFDDPYTIAGQGTVGKEILQDDINYDVIFVPVGGGGLLA